MVSDNCPDEAAAMPAVSDRGRFIVVDGIDGGGKSTQIANIESKLRRSGRDVETVRDPGSTEIGSMLRSILLDSDVKIHRRTEALIFMAARSEMVASVVRPALLGGIDVICDRYLLSTVVYQSVGGEVPPCELWQMGRWAVGGLDPDLTLLLDLPSEISLSRMDNQLDRMESRGAGYLESVRTAYLEQLPLSGGKQVVIDASVGQEAVSTAISAEIDRLLD